LINGISLEETETKIKAYQQENHDLIAANAQRMVWHNVKKETNVID